MRQYCDDKLEQRWKIGQVAELFGLSVQTLRYYDSIGLFSPDYRDTANGYRYYLQTQIYRLANIVYLRKQGYSIDEIKHYLDNLTLRDRSAGLQSQSILLEREMKRLACISNAIKEKLHYIEISDYEEKGSRIEISTVKARHYIEIGLEKDLYASEVFYFFPTVVVYTPDTKIFGACINNRDDLVSYTSLLPNLTDTEYHIRRFDAGHVLRSHYRGPYESIGEHLNSMAAYAAENSISLADYSIHYNIIDQFVESDPQKYVTEIQIPINKLVCSG